MCFLNKGIIILGMSVNGDFIIYSFFTWNNILDILLKKLGQPEV